MKGFLMGALTLIVIEVLGRNTDKASGGLKVIASGIRRALAPNVAGLRNFAQADLSGSGAGPSTGLTRTGRSPNPDAGRGESSIRLPRNFQLPTPGFNKPLP